MLFSFHGTGVLLQGSNALTVRLGCSTCGSKPLKGEGTAVCHVFDHADGIWGQLVRQQLGFKGRERERKRLSWSFKDADSSLTADSVVTFIKAAHRISLVIFLI